MADANEIDQRHYSPFPPFSVWSDIAFDERLYGRYEELLQQTKATVDEDALKAAVRIATRIAAVDTGAIEGLYDVDRGFTRTIAVEAAAWEAALSTRGTAAKRAIEDALAAYEFVLDAATAATKLSEVWIRELHATVCASQETHTVYTAAGPQEQHLAKGAYKALPNSPTNASTGRVHHYAPPDDTPPEMTRLIEELNSAGFRSAHPVIQAAYAHYAFVCIHPFADGNGRVARALASVFLYRRPGVPLVVFADEKPAYLDALESADAGDPLPFVRFIEQHVVDAIEIVRSHVVRTTLPTVEEALARMSGLLVGQHGLTHLEVDAAADRALALLGEEFGRQLNALQLPEGVTQQLGFSTGHTLEPPPGYRAIRTKPRSLSVVLSSSPPAQVTYGHQFGVASALPDNDASDLVLWAMQDPTNPLPLSMREVVPTPTAVLGLKLTGWVEQHLRAMLAILGNNVQATLREGGYI